MLEVGCSVGFNCIGLSKIFPDAEIYGIEPDREAVEVGSAMASENGLDALHFQCGFGESLPFAAGYFDLVVCHTVIEHVHNVEAVISEIARVLSTRGVLHLDAPNYVWPFEPHLGIWCIPLWGKKSTRFFARLQNKSHQIAYLEHLQFVHPALLERCFGEHDLEWENRVEKKLDSIFSGDLAAVKAYGASAKFLNMMGKAGIGRVAEKIILGTRLYPSVLYTVRKSLPR